MKLGDVIEDADFSAKQEALKDITTGHDLEDEAVKVQGEAIKVAKTFEEIQDKALKDKEGAFAEMTSANTLEDEAIKGQKEGLSEFMEGDKLVHTGRDKQAAGEVKGSQAQQLREKTIKDLKTQGQKIKAGKVIKEKGDKYVGLAEEILKGQGQ
jgi:hypothetical protein